MQRTRWQTLLTVAATTAALGWLVLRLLDRVAVEPPPVPWLVCLVMLVIAGVVFTMGWQVRQFLGGKRPQLNPIRAARTAVLAKASCYTGALLAGWYLSQVLAVLGDLSIASQRDRAQAAGLAAVTAILMAVVGLVVEWFCRVPPPEEPEKEPPGPEQAAR
jgi:uncharacterized protein DUF3180